MWVFIYDVADTAHKVLLIGCSPLTNAVATVPPAAPEEPAGEPPSNVTPPTIAGDDSYVGTSWAVDSPGSWTGSPTSYTYQWFLGVGDIPGAVGSTYLLQPGDVGSVITCRVVAVNDGGESDPVSSSNSVTVEALPVPVNTSGPGIIAGLVEVGQTISSNTGDWAYNPTSYLYQWQRDGVGDPVDISGATSASYLIVLADEACNLRCRVTAVNASGDSLPVYTNEVSVPLAASAYQDGGGISGNPWEGETLLAATGTWAPDPTSFSYQWYADAVAIDGATFSTLVVSQAIGIVLTCRVTAHRGDTAIHELLVGVTVIPLPIPSNQIAPSISGADAYEGTTWYCASGTWSPTPDSYSYQWYRDGDPLSGHTDSSYVLAGSDVGSSISCDVAAHNVSGTSAPVGSNSVTVQELPDPPTPPGAGDEPMISGVNSFPGTIWSVTPGVWGGQVDYYTYQWQLDSVPYSGATSSNFELPNSIGSVVSCVVSAHNAGGSNSVTSSNTTTIEEILSPPSNTVAPTIGYSSGTYSITSDGSWTGAPTPSFSYQWYDGGGVIVGATSPSIAGSSIMSNGYVSCEVTATNSEGSASAVSSNTIYHDVSGTAPSNSVAPVISQSGSSFNLDSAGTWAGNPTPSLTYQWLSDGNNIEGATGTSADASLYGNTTISVRETAANEHGTVSADSNGIFYAP